MTSPWSTRVNGDHRQSDAVVRRHRRRLWLLVVLVVGGFGLATVMVVGNPEPDAPAGPGLASGRPSADATPQPQEGVLLDIEGEGDAVTDRFAARENWEIRWQAAGNAPFTVELFADDGQARGAIVEAEVAGDGSTFVSEAGTFYFLVSTDGPWKVQVLGEEP